LILILPFSIVLVSELLPSAGVIRKFRITEIFHHIIAGNTFFG
jgi:hypothetical protein